MDNYEIIVAIDMGATKIRCAIGKVNEQKRINIIGIGCSPPSGMENGTVADVDLLSGSIEKAVTEAEEVAGIEIESAFVGIAQTNFRGISGRGIVSIPSAGREINKKDVNRVIEVARVVAIRSNEGPVEELVQEFIVDGQGGIQNPIGMYGFKLEAEVYMVTGTLSTFSRTIIECVKNCGISVEGITFKPLAAGEAVLSGTEKKTGVLLIDFGGESTSTVVFMNGNVAGARILAVGANQITTDIANKFHIPAHTAEMIKRNHGCALASLVEESEQVDISSDGETSRSQIPRYQLAEVIQNRIESIFTHLRREIENTRFPRGTGETIALTGGGALMEGIEELAHQKFNLPVRTGKPDGKIQGWGKVINNPAYSTLFGLLPTGLAKRQLMEVKSASWQNPFSKSGNWFKKLFQ